MKSWLTVLRTVAHLRFGQLGYQILRRVQGRFSRPPAGACSLPDPDRFRPGDPPEALPAYAPVPGQDCRRLLEGSFCFLNDSRRLGRPIDWTVSDAPLLWRYNLHYFDWLWSLDFTSEPHWRLAREAIADWIHHLTPPAAAVAWAPYPTSLRLINWSLLLLGGAGGRLDRDPQLAAAVAGSMWRQLAWLARRLEYHLRANHLFENAVALVLAASCFEGRDAGRWRRCGRRILARELPEQLLPDGCHYERSPMYHARILWLLETLAAARPELAAELAIGPYRERALRALDQLVHPDGEIALLNDAAGHVYRLPPDCSTRQLPGVWALPDAGYYGARTAAGEYVVVDAAAIGPDYQPGHAHADLLSFEWSLDGHRTLTDTGVYAYQVGESRQYDRSTAAHNTVTIDGLDSCEVWGGFRVGRRVRPSRVEWQPDGDRFRLAAQHAGFSGWIHHRSFSWQPGRLQLDDRVQGRRAGAAVARFHLAPHARVESERSGRALVRWGRLRLAVTFTGPGELRVEDGWYSCQFGLRQQRPVLAYHLPPGRSAEWTTRWERK